MRGKKKRNRVGYCKNAIFNHYVLRQKPSQQGNELPRYRYKKPNQFIPLGHIWHGAMGLCVVFVFVEIQSIATWIYHFRVNPGVPREDLYAMVRNQHNMGMAFSVATLTTTFLCVPLMFGIAKLKRGSQLNAYLGFSRVSLKVIGQWLTLTFVLMLVASVVGGILGRPAVNLFMKAIYTTADPVWVLWLAIGIGAPVTEEIFFRGFLHKGFESTLKPVGTTIAISALWAGIHIQYELFDVATLFALGLLLGIARSRTGSIVPPIAMHFLWNMLACAGTAFLI